MMVSRPNLARLRPVMLLLLLLILPAATRAMPLREPGGTLGQVATMRTPRAAHTATALSDGRVFLAGGCTIDSCELGPAGATTEFFDPATARFSAGPTMATPRVSHSAILLQDGRVLILGGWGPDGALTTTEIYDPDANAFSTAAAMSTPRGDAFAALLPDGRVLVAGGNLDEVSLASAEIYDPVRDTFTPTGEMTIPRSYHVGTTLHDGRILIIGGEDAKETLLASAEIYDPTLGTFTATGSLATARYKHAATALSDGRVLVVGGSDQRDYQGKLRSLEVFDPATGEFSSAGEMAEARFKIGGSVVPLASGQALITGDGQNVELFTGTSGTLVVHPPLTAAYSLPTATAIDTGVLITGGYDDSLTVTNAAWLWVGTGDGGRETEDGGR